MLYMIVPVYNTAAYLEDTIESIINQSVSFREQIRVHLIDDASSDNSLEICKKYEETYPDNIRVTHFDENKGVSAVRNYGIAECLKEEDAIVGFLDSDDKIAEDFIEKVLVFFEEHKNINIAATEIHYFGAVTKEHKSNWRFAEREIVNIYKDYNFPQYYIGGTFFRGKALQKLVFDENMSFWEDALAISKVILSEGRYGLVKGARYYYRKREDGSSLVEEAWRSEERYTTFIEKSYVALMDYCRKKKFRIIPYIQHLVVYHMRLYMTKSRTDIVTEVLTEDELIELRERLGKILRKIRLGIILELPTSLPIIEAMLSLRKGKPVRTRRIYGNNECLFVYRGRELARMSERQVRLFYIFDEPEYKGMWRGRFCTPIYAMRKDDYIFAEHNGERVDSIEYPCRKQLFILGQRMRCYYHAGFAIRIPEQWDKAVFGIHIAEGDIDVYMNEIVFDEVEKKYI